MKRLLLTCTDLMAIQFLVPHVKYLSEHGFSVELACSEVGGRLQELCTVLSGIAPVHTVRLVRNPFSLRNRKGLSDLKKIINGRSWDVIWTNEPVMGVMTRVAAKTVRKKGRLVRRSLHTAAAGAEITDHQSPVPFPLKSGPRSPARQWRRHRPMYLSLAPKTT